MRERLQEESELVFSHPTDQQSDGHPNYFDQFGEECGRNKKEEFFVWIADLGAVHIDCEDYDSDTWEDAREEGIDLPRNKTIMFCSPHPQVYILECISIEEFGMGVPESIWKFIRERNIYVYGSDVAKDLIHDDGYMPTSMWTDCQVMLYELKEEAFSSQSRTVWIRLGKRVSSFSMDSTTSRFE